MSCQDLSQLLWYCTPLDSFAMEVTDLHLPVPASSSCVTSDPTGSVMEALQMLWGRLGAVPCQVIRVDRLCNGGCLRWVVLCSALRVRAGGLSWQARETQAVRQQREQVGGRV